MLLALKLSYFGVYATKSGLTTLAVIYCFVILREHPRHQR